MLRNAVGSYTINVSGIHSLDNVRVCTKTATPTTNAAAYWKTNCTYLAASNGNKTVSVTQAMVNNGGFVMVAHVNTPSSEAVRRAEWIALVSPDIVLSESSITVAEGSADVTYTVKLNVRPTGNVKVRVQRGGLSFVMRSGTSNVLSQDLVFAQSNWNTAQTVTVRALDDNNVAGESSNITHTTVNADTASEYHSASETLTVTVTDDDGEMVVSRSGALALTEGSSGTYNVKLKGQPATGQVAVIRVSSGDGNVVSVNKTGGTAGASQDLTFTNSNWNTDQAITLTAEQDNDAADPSAVTITHAVIDASTTASEFHDAADVAFAVNVSDDDGGIVVSQSATLTIAEGSSGTYNVKLKGQPATGQVVVVRVSSGDDGAVKVNKTGGTAAAHHDLTFTNSDWNTNQAVTLTGEQDDDSDDESVTITHAVRNAQTTANEFDDATDVTFTAAVTDDESVEVRVSATSLTVTEATGSGRTATFTVRLGSKPTADVVIGVSGDDGSEGSVSPLQLTFTQSDWNQTQTVTVTAVDDDVDDGNVDWDVTLASPTSADTDYSGLSSETVDVSTTDDDTKGVTVSATAVTVTEAAGAGRSTTYTVVLDSEPTANVTVTPSSGSTSVAEVTTSRTDNTLVFTANNWDTAQDVTVTGVDNAVDESSDQTTTISHAVTGATGSDYASGVTAASVSVTLTDDDSKRVIISKSSETINESGAGNSFVYTIKLGSQPTGTVTVSVSAPSGIATLDTTSLTFEANDNSNKIWSRAQNVTVTAVDNNVDDATARSGDVTHTVTGADYASGVPTPGSVTVTLTDDDTAGVSVSESSVSVTEQGSGVDYTVVLTSEPSANVTVDISSGDADVKVATGSGTATGSLTLTFTPTGTGIWSTAQTVTVTAADDADSQNETVTLTQSIGTGSASEYSSVSVANVTVNVTDNDTPNLDVSRTTGLGLTEGGNSTYNVKLTTQPSSDVVVEITSDNSDVTVKKAGEAAAQSIRLTFTPSGAGIWSTAQVVTVASVADTDSLDDGATITHRVVAEDSDDNYDGVTSKTFTVSVTDTTLAGLSIADASASEGSGRLDFTVTLGMASSRTVTVVWTLAAGTATAGTQSGGDYDDSTDTGTLTFSSGGSLTQTISVPIVDDPVVEPDETVTVTLSGPTNASLSDGSATGTIRNDDTAGVRITPERSQRTTTEDAAGTVDLMVSLSSRPSADVKVTVTSADTTEGKVKEEGEDDPVLDFTTGNWNTPHRVTVTGVDDDDLDGDVEYNVRFAFSDGPGAGEDTDYTGLDPVDVALTNLDDDLSILSVSGGGEVAEGDSGTTAQATFTVTLAPARRQAVSVSYATSDGTAEAGSDYESASGTVTFSPGETSKTVTVTINGDDEAEANETFTLALTSTPNGQIDPQNSSAGAVIKNDDEKMVDAGMSGEFSVGETTVTVDSTLPDDTGLEVMLPAELERGGSAIEELTVTLGPTEREIDGDLFGYTGSGEDHVLVDIDVSPVPDDAVRICLPVTENLRRAAGEQRLYLIRFSGGRWEELSSETEDDMVCADVRGFSPFAVVFEIDYAKRRVGEVNRAILPELNRAMTASTLEAITSRIDDAMAGGGTTGALGAPSPPEQEYGHAEPGLRLGEFEDGEELSLTDAVDGSYYSVSLAGGYDPMWEEEGESEAELAPASRSGGLGMWISGDYRNLSGKGGGLVDWDGRVISGHLGADYRFGRSFLAGVATSWSQGSFDYTGRGEGSARVSGDYGSRMNSFHPYLGLSLSRRLNLWAAGGWGFGEIRMDDGEITGRQRASTRLGTLAAGADLVLLGGDVSSLSLKGEAWISRVKVKGNGGRIEGLRVKTNRLRAALEGSHALAFGSGSLVPSLEFAIRRDGGDGETGVGGELGGGISVVSSVGLTVEARGRGLLFHQGDAKEWGVGGSVRFDPGGDERGLSMSVIPSWGNSASGVQSLWESEGAEVGSADTERSLSLETEVGYGFAALGDRGLLTPYGAFGRAGGDGRSYRAGSRLSVGGMFDVSLEGLRTETGAGDPEHGITLQGRLNW